MKAADRATAVQARAVEALLPAFVWVLGSQAWRLALGTLSHDDRGVWTVLGAALALTPVLAAPAMARRWGAPRAAAAVALVLAGARALAALVGPAAAGAYGWLGTSAFALYLSLWPAACPSRRQAGHALMLGLSLQLLDRILTATLDLAWRPGWWAMVCALLLTTPAIQMARGGLRADEGEPRRSPLPLAMPLVLLACSLALCHPTRLAEPMGLSLPAALWVMALGVVGGMGVAGLTDQFLKNLFVRRARPARLRAAYQVWRTTLTLVAVAGLLSGQTWGLRAAIAVGPTVVAINLAALLRARPIGRGRLLGGPLPLLSWWLTMAMAVQARDHLWPAAAALGLLYGYATVALYNQERVDPTHERVEYWTLLGHALLLAAAAWPALAPVGLPTAQPLADDRLTVAVVDVASSPAAVARRLAAVRAARPRLVLLIGGRGGGDGLRFEDSAWWLSRSLGLTVRLQSQGDLAMLAATPALETSVLGPRAMAGLWTLTGDNGLAAAVVNAPERGSDVVDKTLPALTTWPRRLLAGRLADGALPPPGYDDLLDGEPCELVLWGSGGVTANVVSHPAPGALCVEVVIEP